MLIHTASKVKISERKKKIQTLDELQYANYKHCHVFVSFKILTNWSLSTLLRFFPFIHNPARRVVVPENSGMLSPRIQFFFWFRLLFPANPHCGPMLNAWWVFSCKFQWILSDLWFNFQKWLNKKKLRIKGCETWLKEIYDGGAVTIVSQKVMHVWIMGINGETKL